MLATFWQAIAQPYEICIAKRNGPFRALWKSDSDLQKQHAKHFLFVRLDARLAVDSSTAVCRG